MARVSGGHRSVTPITQREPRTGARAGLAPERSAEVSWFDVREITLAAADLAGLDARETARAAAFVFPADRHRYQVAHVMLRRLLAGYLGTEPGRLAFAREPCPACGGPAGRPVLASPAAPATPAPATAPPGPPAPVPCFSLAHSGDAVVIAVAGRPVGVDVEREATGCVCSLVTAMNPGDAAIVEALPEPERHAAVIRWWVRAEAVLKRAGTGIGHGMDAFPVLRGGGAFTPLSAPRGYQAAIALPGLRLIRYRWASARSSPSRTGSLTPEPRR
jgi:4'-phosphopantetheinyl transferase